MNFRYLCHLLIGFVFISCAQAIEMPPHVTVNLDLDPRDRWKGAVETCLNYHSFDDGFRKVFEYHNDTLFHKLSSQDWAALANAVNTYWPEQAIELQSISEQFKSLGYYVSFEYLAGWVYYHSLAHSDFLNSTLRPKSCTGIVVQSSNGNMHAANMDQSPSAARNTTLRVTFTSNNGTKVVHGVDWYWFTTGLTRMISPGVVSIQENWRFQANGIPFSKKDVLADIAAGATPQVFVFRHALLELNTYEGILKNVTNLRLAAPFYVVMAGSGPGEGAVVTRNRTAAVDILHLNETRDKWFVVQTNYDHWVPDNRKDPRRSAAEATLRQVGRENAATDIGAFAVASQYPVHNPHTLFTAIMSPLTGMISVYVRQGLCPSNALLAWWQEDLEYCKK